MFKVDKKKMIRGKGYRITDKLILKQYTIDEILDCEDVDIMNKYTIAQSIFLTAPKDKIIELYEQGIFYKDINKYDMFIGTCFNIIKSKNDLEDGLSLGKIFSCLFEGDLDLDFTILQENDKVFLKDINSDIIIDEEIYNNIREVLKVMICREDYDFDKAGRGIVGKQGLEAYVAKEKRQMYARSRRKNKEEDIDHLEYMMSFVINVGNNGIDYFNIGDCTLFQIYHSFNKQKSLLDYPSVLAGYYSNIDWTKANLQELLKIN